MSGRDPTVDLHERYWDGIADKYNAAISISTGDFHYGPLAPGDSELGLLPRALSGLKCLEIGCGAGQNSVFLAGRGAECDAFDISRRQLAHAAKNAAKAGATVNFFQLAMEDVASLDGKKYDLIHSSYAVAFAGDPAKVVADAARLLVPGGVFLLSTGHPLFSGLWMESGKGSGDSGLFIRDYFFPAPDVRFDDKGDESVRAEFHPVGRMADWFLDAGLSIERILEPEPRPVDGMSVSKARAVTPYVSKGWLGLYDQLRHIPSVVVFKCVKRPPEG